MNEPVIDLLCKLISFDTSNWGDGKSNGETECARWIEGLLTEAGYEPVFLARDDSPHRGNLVVRVEGTEPDLPALCVQGHLDVVPAELDEWSVEPFEGIVKDGYVYGRGATDMKDFVANMLAVLLAWSREGVRPRRTMVFAFVADEEAGSDWGADFLVDQHPELFAGCAASIGEDGAICQPATTVDGRAVRLYPIACGERGASHIRITGRGPSGHGSRPSGDDAVRRVLEAVHRVANHEWPLHISTVVGAQLEASAEALGMTVDLADEASIKEVITQLGDAAGPLPWTIRVSATPTVLQAGYKVNVIPSVAVAEIDVRCPPGTTEATNATLAELIGDDVDWEFTLPTVAIESDPHSEWFAAMRDAVLASDPEGVVVPYCMGGGTDSKAFARLGMATYGFTPLTADPEGRVLGGIHGKDERNPVAGIVGGHAILKRFLTTV